MRSASHSDAERVFMQSLPPSSGANEANFAAKPFNFSAPPHIAHRKLLDKEVIDLYPIILRIRLAGSFVPVTRRPAMRRSIDTGYQSRIDETII